jgi:hypothetical protein
MCPSKDNWDLGEQRFFPFQNLGPMKIIGDRLQIAIKTPKIHLFYCRLVIKRKKEKKRLDDFY